MRSVIFPDLQEEAAPPPPPPAAAAAATPDSAPASTPAAPPAPPAPAAPAAPAAAAAQVRAFEMSNGLRCFEWDDWGVLLWNYQVKVNFGIRRLFLLILRPARFFGNPGRSVPAIWVGLQYCQLRCCQPAKMDLLGLGQQI